MPIDKAQLVKWGLGVAAAAFTRDAIVRPKQLAMQARAHAMSLGRPMLNLGASGTTIHGLLTGGEKLWGDVNLDDDAPVCAAGPAHVAWCDYYDLRAWPDQHFGSLFATGVLERLERPDLALREWNRVAHRLFIAVPSWWNPAGWLNRWYIDPEVRRAFPVWTQTERVVLLPVSDSREYAARRCQTPIPTSSKTRTSPQSPQRPSPSAPRSPSAQPAPSRSVSEPTDSSSVVTTLSVISAASPEKS